METYNQIFVMCNQDLTITVTANSLKQAQTFCESKTNDYLYCIAHYQLFINSQYELAMYKH